MSQMLILDREWLKKSSSPLIHLVLIHLEMEVMAWTGISERGPLTIMLLVLLDLNFVSHSCHQPETADTSIQWFRETLTQTGRNSEQERSIIRTAKHFILVTSDRVFALPRPGFLHMWWPAKEPAHLPEADWKEREAVSHHYQPRRHDKWGPSNISSW